MTSARQEMITAHDAGEALWVQHATAAARVADGALQLDATLSSLPTESDYATARDLLTQAQETYALDVSAKHGALEAGPLTTALNALSDLMQPGGAKAIDAITKALTAYSKAQDGLRDAQDALDDYDIELQKIEERLTTLGNVKREDDKTLWCADYSTELKPDTTVGTIEVPGEPQEILIQPDAPHAATGRALYDARRDGLVTPALALTKEALFYNWCMAPAWQRFRPSYRFAIVTKVNNDNTLALKLTDPNITGYGHGAARRIDITPKTLADEEVDYSAVRVAYLDCGAAAFTVGDAVVVRFEGDAGKPEVIGFRDHPRACAAIRLATPRVVLSHTGEGGEWQATNKELTFGNVNWIGKTAQKAVSWLGAVGRYWYSEAERGLHVWMDGAVIATAPEGGSERRVIGAAYRTVTSAGGASARYLVVVTFEFENDTFETMIERCWRYQLDETNAWEQIGAHSWHDAATDKPSTVEPVGQYFFNDSATEARATKRYTFTRTLNAHDVTVGAWSRQIVLIVAADLSEASFAWHEEVNALPIFESTGTLSLPVAADYRGDELVELICTVAWANTGGGGTAITTLSLGEWSCVVGQGDQALGGFSRGKYLLYVDLRTEPPCVVYRTLANKPDYPGTWGLALQWREAETEVVEPITAPGLPDFGNRFSGILRGTFDSPFLFAATAPHAWCATDLAGNLIVADLLFEMNALQPTGELLVLDPDGGVFIDKVGVV